MTPFDSSSSEADSGAPGRGAGPKRPRIIALMNQKGGVGKTTTSVNLGAALADRGVNVLLIDLDPQAHLTIHLGIEPTEVAGSVYDLLTDDGADPARIARRVSPRLTVLPAEVDLAAAESEISGSSDRQRLLKRRLADYTRQFDYVLIDCPPSLGLLTINALALANEVIVPMQAHFLALQGLSKLLETVQLVRLNVNTKLRVGGVVLCMHDAHTNLTREVVSDLQGFFEQSRTISMPWSGARVFEPPIRRNIKLAECPSFGQSIFQYEPNCAGAHDYLELAHHLLERDGLRSAEVEKGSSEVESASTDVDSAPENETTVEGAWATSNVAILTDGVANVPQTTESSREAAPADVEVDMEQAEIVIRTSHSGAAAASEEGAP